MRQIDTKYKTSGTITKLDGTPIPDDEPLILFRGRDRLLVQMLEHYLQLRRKANSSNARLQLLNDQIEIIKQWQTGNPNKTKTPE